MPFNQVDFDQTFFAQMSTYRNPNNRIADNQISQLGRKQIGRFYYSDFGRYAIRLKVTERDNNIAFAVSKFCI